MKVYRRSFGRAETSRFVLIPLLLGIWLFLPYVIDLVYHYDCFEFHPVLFLPIGSFVFLFLVSFSQYFYVIVKYDQLIIRNSIFVFWKKECFYKDIVKMRIGWAGGRSLPYIQVYTSTKKGWRWQYVIDLVDPKRYNELIDDIRAKGVLVEVKNLEHFTEYYKPDSVES